MGKCRIKAFGLWINQYPFAFGVVNALGNITDLVADHETRLRGL